MYERTPDGEERKLTGFNREFCSRGGLVRPGFFQVESAPGAEVDAWVGPQSRTAMAFWTYAENAHPGHFGSR